MKKFSFLIFLSLVSSCASKPHSTNSIAAGILAHAGYHNDQRKLKKPYTAKEEKDAKIVGKNMEEIWDQHQSNNQIATIAQAQAFLDRTHAQINNLFPTGKKPFPPMYRPLNR